jgi:opacity protein-like surface antigen
MRRFLILMTGVVLLVPLSLMAQENPKAEFFGGYSYLRTNITDRYAPTVNGFYPAQDYNLHGWEGSANFNLNNWFGLKADFSGHYDLSQAARENTIVGSNIHTFLFGPQFTSRASERFQPYVHALVGAARGAYDYNSPFSDIVSTKLAMAFGGGVDIRLSNAVALRLIQADYLMTRFGSSSDFNLKDRQDNVRLGAGLVFRIR